MGLRALARGIEKLPLAALHIGRTPLSDPAAARLGAAWAANKSFKILKFKVKFPIARTFELFRARSRLYRSQLLQVNTRWKALDEIYKIYMLLHRTDLNISAKIVEIIAD